MNSVFDLVYCCLPHKGTNFLANHNSDTWIDRRHSIVVYPTKVLIF